MYSRWASSIPAGGAGLDTVSWEVGEVEEASWSASWPWKFTPAPARSVTANTINQIMERRPFDNMGFDRPPAFHSTFGNQVRQGKFALGYLSMLVCNLELSRNFEGPLTDNLPGSGTALVPRGPWQSGLDRCKPIANKRLSHS